MSLDQELAYISATELASRIRNRDLSPVEVVDSCIERIEARNPSLNAFVYKGYDDAIKAARAAENALRENQEVGVLHGIPIAIKDLFDFKPGWVSTLGGIRALENNVTEHYCAFAERVEKAGGIIVGKTNSPTMGFRGTCDNYLFGPTCNPFDLTKNTGGSSGGSAAAVADGMVPLAEGTDGGGSIRIPAAWCNVYGYKASFGRIPFIVRPNAFASATPFLFEGPITRTVGDAALAMSALAGHDPRDPYSLTEQIDFMSATTRPIEGWKIAYSPDLDVFPVEPEVTRIVERSVRTFEEAGATVEQVKVGINRPQNELSDLWCRLILPANVAAFESMKDLGVDLLANHSSDFPPEYLRWIELGYDMKVIQFFRDQETRSEIFDSLQSVLTDYDLLVTPTLACMPVDNADDGNTLGPSQINGEAVNPLIGWCLTYLVNFTGHPAASIPAGLSDAGLPVGMQIIGRRYNDTDVLTASSVFERLRPWAESYSVCRNRHT